MLLWTVRNCNVIFIANIAPLQGRLNTTKPQLPQLCVMGPHCCSKLCLSQIMVVRDQEQCSLPWLLVFVLLFAENSVSWGSMQGLHWLHVGRSLSCATGYADDSVAAPASAASENKHWDFITKTQWKLLKSATIFNQIAWQIHNATVPFTLSHFTLSSECPITNKWHVLLL